MTTTWLAWTCAKKTSVRACFFVMVDVVFCFFLQLFVKLITFREPNQVGQLHHTPPKKRNEKQNIISLRL